MAAGFQISVLAESAIRLLLKAQLTREDLDDIGRYGESIVRRESTQSFQRQADPATGKAWAPLKYARKRGKTSNAQVLLDTGRLRRSVGATHTVHGHTLEIFGGITPIAYGTIHQFGGRTAPHTIVPKRAKALFWAGAKHPVKRVNHPGSRIPARPYVGISAMGLSLLLSRIKDRWEGAKGRAT